MPFTYTPNTPQTPNFPANDQPLMTANNQYLQEFGQRDHQFTLTSAINNTDGTHKQVTLTNEAAPGFTGASSAIYANLANGQSQLFFQNASPANVQLTVIKPAAGSDKAVPSINAGPPYQSVTFLPGGMLIQFGNSTASTVTFPVAFKAGTTPSVTISASSTVGGQFPTVSSTNTGFSRGAIGGGGVMQWIAVGEA